MDGSSINVYGSILTDIIFGKYKAEVNIIVCDISLPGILGQDFITKHIKQWDLETLELCTKDGYIMQCGTWEETKRVCRIIVEEEVQVPPKTCVLVPVKISNFDTLPETAFVDGMDVEKGNDIHVLRGIMNPRDKDPLIGVMNESESVYKMKEGQEIGHCHPVVEDVDTDVRVTNEYLTPTEDQVRDSHKSEQELLPEHLKEMFDKSKENLDNNERERFAALLNKYQDVFA